MALCREFILPVYVDYSGSASAGFYPPSSPLATFCFGFLAVLRPLAQVRKFCFPASLNSAQAVSGCLHSEDSLLLPKESKAYIFNKKTLFKVDSLAECSIIAPNVLLTNGIISTSKTFWTHM